jgi:hypothetical protein
MHALQIQLSVTVVDRIRVKQKLHCRDATISQLTTALEAVSLIAI